jgi:hypothetical protein
MHSNNKNNNKNNDSKNNKNNDNDSKNNKNNDNSNNSNNSNNSKNTDNNSKRVLRFEFSNATIESVMGFTTVHQYDDRKTYKEAWAQWLAHDEIAAMLKSEVERLTNLGYKGDVADKLFKSGRYYFRTREPTDRGTTCQALRPAPLLHTPPSRATSTPNDANGARRGSGNLGSPRKYVTMGRELLRAMDDHIERGLRTNDAYTPAIGFSDFFRTHASSDLLKTEVGNLIRHYETVPNPAKKLHAKLKKTYKNRYFMMVQCNTCNTK